MTIIDERGRLFGKLNVIDALVILGVVILMPVAYGAYVLFRAPVPEITSIEPTTLTQAKGLTITIRGTDLRPYLRARIGTTFSPFLIESPSSAEVKLPDLPPGSYDLSIFDEAREVARRPSAITIVAPPPPPPPPPAPAAPTLPVQVFGTFLGVEKQEARALRPGSRLANPGGPFLVEILAVRPPEQATRSVKAGTTALVTPVAGQVQVSALLRVRCTIVNDTCAVGEVLLAPNAILSLPGSTGTLRFLVDSVRSGDSPPTFPDPPPAQLALVEAIGTFTGLDDQEARLIQPGARFPAGTELSLAEVTSVQPPEPAMQRVMLGPTAINTPLPGKVQVQAIVRLRCSVLTDGCRVSGVQVARDAALSLPVGEKGLRFLVREVRPIEPLSNMQALVRFVVRPEIPALIKAGDVDLGRIDGDEKYRAVLTKFTEKEKIMGSTNIMVNTPASSSQKYISTVEQPMVVIEGELRIPVQKVQDGWQYKNQILKVGDVLTFETPAYAMHGWLLSAVVTPTPRPAAPASK